MDAPLVSAVWQLKFDIDALSAFVARIPLGGNGAEQLNYVAHRLGDLQTEARNIEHEARRR